MAGRSFLHNDLKFHLFESVSSASLKQRCQFIAIRLEPAETWVVGYPCRSSLCGEASPANPGHALLNTPSPGGASRQIRPYPPTVAPLGRRTTPPAKQLAWAAHPTCCVQPFICFVLHPWCTFSPKPNLPHHFDCSIWTDLVSVLSSTIRMLCRAAFPLEWANTHQFVYVEGHCN